MSVKKIEQHICDGCGVEITPEQVGAEVNATMFDEVETDAKGKTVMKDGKPVVKPYVRRIELCGEGEGLGNCAANLPEGVRQAKRGRKATEAVAA